MKSTKPSFFSGPDFSQGGSKTFQASRIHEINFSDITLTKKTVHEALTNLHISTNLRILQQVQDGELVESIRIFVRDS